MSAEYFLDTNLFIYQLEADDKRKADIANTLIRQGIEAGNACISHQVVQECLNTMLRKAQIPLSTGQTRRYLEGVLSPLMQVTASMPLYQRALDIRAHYKYHFYDALIIAAALAAGCTTLYSDDMPHGQTIETLTITNPFLPTEQGNP
jgi:predicted nucleic acid-binding protein